MSARDHIVPFGDTFVGITRDRLKKAGDTDPVTSPELIREAYARLAADNVIQPKDRQEFFASASKKLRRILVNHAVRAMGGKRSGSTVRVSLSQLDAPVASLRPQSIIALDEALVELGLFDPQASVIVEYRYFGGLGFQEIAGLLSISEQEAIASWQFSRAWLHQRLGDPGLT